MPPKKVMVQNNPTTMSDLVLHFLADFSVYPEFSPNSRSFGEQDVPAPCFALGSHL